MAVVVMGGGDLIPDQRQRKDTSRHPVGRVPTGTHPPPRKRSQNREESVRSSKPVQEFVSHVITRAIIQQRQHNFVSGQPSTPPLLDQ